MCAHSQGNRNWHSDHRSVSCLKDILCCESFSLGYWPTLVGKNYTSLQNVGLSVSIMSPIALFSFRGHPPGRGVVATEWLHRNLNLKITILGLHELTLSQLHLWASAIITCMFNLVTPPIATLSHPDTLTGLLLIRPFSTSDGICPLMVP